MLLVLTVCTLRQLPQALALGNAIRHYHSDATFCIGLADKAATLTTQPLAVPVVPVAEVLDQNTLNRLSAQYTPTEFAAAVKPTLIRAMLAQQPEADSVVYFDPNAFPNKPLTEVLNELATAQFLLTPYWTAPPADSSFPDEKYLQNIGLYTADFLAFRRSNEAERMLAWWEDRVQSRAQIDFCESLCLDQIWLMHLPALFEGVRIVTDRRWHRGIWNAHESISESWQSILWFNYKGLYNPDEGFFVHQTRFNVARNTPLKQHLAHYRQEVVTWQNRAFDVAPAYGQRPERPVVRGWRREAGMALRSITRFVETVPLPVIK